MKLCILLSLFWGLASAQEGVDVSETEKTDTIQSCFPDMCKLLMEFGAMKEKLGAVEAKLEDSETRLKDSETRLKASETRLKDSETRLKDSETRLTDSENQIRELKNKEHEPVIFSAATGGSGHIGPFTSHTTVVYRVVKTNIGNAYNPATGIFAAPVAGIYYFTFFYHAGGSNIVSLHLMKNDQGIVQMYDHKTSGDGADNGGNAAFVQLQQGDQVFVRLNANSHVWGNSEITTFSGFLVSKT
ncbi:uncharacterized protein V6R79_007172 [Siganus canaliculatus]